MNDKIHDWTYVAENDELVWGGFFGIADHVFLELDTGQEPNADQRWAEAERAFLALVEDHVAARRLEDVIEHLQAQIRYFAYHPIQSDIERGKITAYRYVLRLLRQGDQV